MSEDPNDNEEAEIFDFPTRVSPKFPVRLTLVETLYYQRQKEEPFSLVSRVCKEIISEEDPYQRSKKVGEHWESLDLGWLKEDVGMIRITNEAGKEQRGVPTAEEKESLAKQVLQVCLSEGGNWLLIPPGETLRFRSILPHEIQLRSASGAIRYGLYILPR